MDPASPRILASGSLWQRLHAALMPDYNRKTTLYWWLVVLAGSMVLLWCLAAVARLPWPALAQLAVGLVLAIGAGLFPVRVPGIKQSFAAGEIFIFLVLLMQGPAAAAIAAAAEAAMGSYRTSKRWTSRLGSPAMAALAMWSLGSGLQAALAWIEAAGRGGATMLLAAATVFSTLYFLLVAQLMAGLQRLERNESFFQLLDLRGVLRWVGMAYVGSATVATLLFITYRQQGPAVLMVMVPLLVMLLLSLHLDFRQQETTEALRGASAAAAAREAEMAAAAARANERHLRELQVGEQRFHSAFTHASIGMALLDFDGRILQANPALLGLLGVAEDRVLQRPFQDFVLLDDRPFVDQRLGLRNRRDFEGFERELRCWHADGSTLWLALHCSFFSEPDAATPCLILQAQDVTARRRAEAGLQQMAFHDVLTGLPNRRRFLECLDGAVTRGQADPRHAWALMFLDFDRFKLVNDSLGHSAGDELLKQMARRVQENLRPGDVVARLGGDEFAILAERIEHERGAVVLAERLMDALRRPFQLGDVELIASASIGITFSVLGYASAEEALRDADTAMYKAKLEGKARYAIFDSSQHRLVSERLRLESDLHHAIARGQLTLVYQPMFELVPGAQAARLSGFEALVRWQHPSDGTLVPASFLQIAEESGLMLQLTDFVLHGACRQLRQWQLADPALAEVTMSVNLSAPDLSHPALVARVSRALVEAQLRPACLTLELTENILMSKIDGASDTLADLRRLGVRLAVDDFGTGYSSLGHLAKLPIDSLKIDRSFVSHLQRDSADAAVVSAIIQLGGTLHKTVVAEGIETAAQAQHLRDLGCGFGQGFHLATPQTGLGIGRWLQTRRNTLH